MDRKKPELSMDQWCRVHYVGYWSVAADMERQRRANRDERYRRLAEAEARDDAPYEPAPSATPILDACKARLAAAERTVAPAPRPAPAPSRTRTRQATKTPASKGRGGYAVVYGQLSDGTVTTTEFIASTQAEADAQAAKHRGGTVGRTVRDQSALDSYQSIERR